MVVQIVLFSSTGSAAPAGSFEEEVLYGMQLCVDLGPGAPASLVEKALGKPSETEKLDSSTVGARYYPHGNLCALMIDVKTEESMGVSYFLKVNKFGLSFPDMNEAIKRVAEPIYGKPRTNDKAYYFRVKSKYFEGHNDVVVAGRLVDGEDNIVISQTFF
ncbi:MAG: hypothetical protein LBG15_02340 [Dysgonamonadaceae bacterium]|jgi:hypothetical protein|nr:hypothetical protein [Dysgonamonadaceae bacterium]